MPEPQLNLDFDLPPPVPRPPQPTKEERAALRAAQKVHNEALLNDIARMMGARVKQPKPQPFNYTTALGEVVHDVVATLDEEFAHIDLNRVLLSITQARQKSKHGVYASCMPLRFENGEREQRRGRYGWEWRPLKRGDHEILYILYFMLPRFHQEIDYPEKLATIIHELYHISPHFNGDVRRFAGKNYAHGHSREVYHEAMRVLAKEYLAKSSRAESWEFLHTPFEELLERPGGVVGYSIPRPQPKRLANR
jgi:hypothetical protein